MERDCKVVVTITKILTEKEFEKIEHKLKDAASGIQIDEFQHGNIEIKKTKLKCKHKEKTLAHFDAGVILNLVASGVQEFVFEGYKISLAKKRYKLFAQNPSCVCCGMTGTTMILEKNVYENVPHFNLYGNKSCGKKVLMTKDHILPQSKGGNNDHDNLQTMCAECNNLKDNTILTLEQIKDLKSLYDNLENKIKNNNDRKKFINLYKFIMQN